MAANLPSAPQWAALSKKHGLNDTTVHKALVAYERIGDDKPAQRAASLDEVARLAGVLKQSRQAKTNAEAGKAIEGVAASAKAASKVHLAAAEKAKAAEKQKPDPAKVKALLTALRKLGRLPDVDAGGPGASKDPRSLPCYAEKERADMAFLKLELHIIGALAIGGPLGLLRELVNNTLNELDAVNDALAKWHDCLRRYRNAQAGAVEARVGQVRTLRAGLQRERDLIDRWNRTFG